MLCENKKLVLLIKTVICFLINLDKQLSSASDTLLKFLDRVHSFLQNEHNENNIVNCQNASTNVITHILKLFSHQFYNYSKITQSYNQLVEFTEK